MFDVVDPYEVVRNGWFSYAVVFEGDYKVCETNNHWTAKRIAGFLNGAYNLGRMNGMVEERAWGNHNG